MHKVRASPKQSAERRGGLHLCVYRPPGRKQYSIYNYSYTYMTIHLYKLLNKK